jgi:hypothetical protein
MTPPTVSELPTGEAPNPQTPLAPLAPNNSSPVTAPTIKIRSIMDQPLSASGICESSEAPAAVGDQLSHVVAGETSKPVVQAVDIRQPQNAKRFAPKWETTARERVRIAIRKFHKNFKNLVERDANEADA